MGTYLNELRPEDLAWKEIPLSEVLPSPAGGIDTGKKPPEPPVGIGHYKKFRWAKEIKAVAIIPDFQVLTADARGVLPQSYTRADVVSIRPPRPMNCTLDNLADHTRARSSIYSALPYYRSHWANHHQKQT